MKRVAVPLFLAGLLAPGLAWADDRADCIEAFEAGQTLRAGGKLSEAIPKFAVCARDVCPRLMQKLCVDQSTEASALLPTVVLSATDGSNHEVDAKVSVDGVVVATVLDGKAIPVDPGRHTFRFEREGLAAVERQVAVKEGQKGQSVSVQFAPTEPVVLAVVPVVAPAPPALAVPPVLPPEPPSENISHGSWTKMRWAGVGVGSAGIAGVVVGSVFGSMAFSKWSSAQSLCNTPNGCGSGSQAENAKTTGEGYADVSTVAFVAGGVLAAGGIVLFLASPSKTSTSSSAAITPTLGGLQIVGRF